MTIRIARPGQARTLTAAWPERRAASQSRRDDPERGRQADAVPVAERGPRRANSSSGASQPGKIFVSSDQPQMSTAAIARHRSARSTRAGKAAERDAGPSAAR